MWKDGQLLPWAQAVSLPLPSDSILVSVSVSSTASDLGKEENPHLGSTGLCAVCLRHSARVFITSRNVTDLNSGDGVRGRATPSATDGQISRNRNHHVVLFAERHRLRWNDLCGAGVHRGNPSHKLPPPRAPCRTHSGQAEGLNQLCWHGAEN